MQFERLQLRRSRRRVAAHEGQEEQEAEEEEVEEEVEEVEEEEEECATRGRGMKSC